MNESVVNPYAPPAHDRLEVVTRESNRFYVVSPLKLVLLYMGTFSLYGLYWFYQQWAHIKRASKGDEWPVARALFSVFFTHSLFQEFDLTLRRKGVALDWNATGLATGVVVLTLLTSALGRVDANWATWVTMACLPLLAFLLQRAQRAANAACGDPTGSSNAQFTAGNIIWLVIGALWWLLVLAGLMIADYPVNA